MPPFSRGYAILMRVHRISTRLSNYRTACKPYDIFFARKPATTFERARYFSKTQGLKYAVPAKKPAPPKQKRPKKEHLQSSSRSHDSKLPASVFRASQTPKSAAAYTGGTWQEKLLRSPTPTLLYQGPSQGVFTAVCFTAGVLSLAGAAYTYYFFYKLNPFEDTRGGKFARAAEGLGSVVFVYLGLIGIMRPFRLIKSITAVPLNGVASRQLALDIEAQPLLPFKKKGRIVRRLRSELTLDNSLALPPETTPLLRTESYPDQAKADRASQEKGGEYQRNYGLQWPFRKLGEGVSKIFLSTKKMFSINHLRYIKVSGKGTWKLDLAGSWTLDNGRAIDQLISLSD
ncbi:hypothetical protein EV356DRAFT_534228 [Viridothelium virens]|uniref:Uncharacterized protein n=1 Tax=Viridothelium virens TaxID=1048519 RepID=A0A6A6H4V4_VIRVR|nr:hypothetical protein EV356DRAFT_534228 [Viridothelium virens]